MMVTENMVNVMIALQDALQTAVDDDYPDIQDDVFGQFDVMTREEESFCLENYSEYAECFRK